MLKCAIVDCPHPAHRLGKLSCGRGLLPLCGRCARSSRAADPGGVTISVSEYRRDRDRVPLVREASWIT